MKKSGSMKRIALLALILALLMAAIPATALAAGVLEATGARVNVRSGPGENYTDLYTLIRGETVEYTGESAYDSRGVQWYKVQYYSYGPGWVSSRYSRVYGETTSAGSGTTTSYVQASGGDVNIRKTPSLLGMDLGTMREGQTAVYLNQSSTDDRGVVWYYVNFNGTVGWVSSRYATLYAGSISLTRYVTATNGDVNIRKTPSLLGADLGTLTEGNSAVYLGQSSTDDRGVVWYYVSYNGTVGWVSSRYSRLN